MMFLIDLLKWIFVTVVAAFLIFFMWPILLLVFCGWIVIKLFQR